MIYLLFVNRDSTVSTATDYDLGFDPTVEAIHLFSFPQSSNRLRDPFSFLSNGYRGLCREGYKGRREKLTAHSHLLARLRTLELYLHLAVP
jgi:hypothetical protein